MGGETNSTQGPMEMTGGAVAPPTSGAGALVGIFTNPRKTFEALAGKPRILLPFIVVLLAQTVFAMAIFQTGVVKNDTLSKLEAQGKAPEVIEGTEKFFDSPAAPVVGAVTAAVITAFVLLFNSALFFFLGNLMLGARLTFTQYLCIEAYSAVITLVDLAVRAGLAIGKGTLDIRLGLGNLFGDDPGFLGRFLDTLTNPLLLWPTAVAALGVSVFTKKSFGFGVLVVLPAFIIGAILSGTQR